MFYYLKEFAKLRNNSVRDIETQSTQYPKILWLNDIPKNELIDNAIRSNFNSDYKFWINVRKQKEPVKQDFARLSKNLEQWVERSSFDLIGLKI